MADTKNGAFRHRLGLSRIFGSSWPPYTMALGLVVTTFAALWLQQLGRSSSSCDVGFRPRRRVGAWARGHRADLGISLYMTGHATVVNPASPTFTIDLTSRTSGRNRCILVSYLGPPCFKRRREKLISESILHTVPDAMIVIDERGIIILGAAGNCRCRQQHHRPERQDDDASGIAKTMTATSTLCTGKVQIIGIRMTLWWASARTDRPFRWSLQSVK